MTRFESERICADLTMAIVNLNAGPSINPVIDALCHLRDMVRSMEDIDDRDDVFLKELKSIVHEDRKLRKSPLYIIRGDFLHRDSSKVMQADVTQTEFYDGCVESCMHAMRLATEYLR